MYVWNAIYLILNKNKEEEIKVILKRLKTDIMLKNIIRNCWDYSIQYQVILKTKDIFIIKVQTKNKTVVLEYQTKDIISLKNVEEFIVICDGMRGIYITNGYFSDEVLRKFNFRLRYKNIKLEDGYRFLESQIGLIWNMKNLKINKVNFLKYLPY